MRHQLTILTFLLTFVKVSFGTMPCPPVYDIPNPFNVDLYHFDSDVINGLKKTKQHIIITSRFNEFEDSTIEKFYYNQNYTLDSIINGYYNTYYTYNAKGYIKSIIHQFIGSERKGRAKNWDQDEELFSYSNDSLVAYSLKNSAFIKGKQVSTFTLEDIRRTSVSGSIVTYTAYDDKEEPTNYTYIYEENNFKKTQINGETKDSLVYSSSDCKTYLDAYVSGDWKQRICYNTEGQTFYIQTGWSSWVSDSLPIVSEEFAYNTQGQLVRHVKNWNCSSVQEISNFIRNPQTGLISKNIKLRYDTRLRDYVITHTYYTYYN